MDKKIMKLLGVCLFAVASVGVLTACSDNDAENPEGGKPGGEDVNPAPEVVEFVNSNLVYWGDKDGVGTDHFVLTLYTDMEVDATGNPIGPGKIMAFSLNVPPFASEGADSSFTVYEDEGDNYNYEKGDSSSFEIIWNDKNNTLTISDRKGGYSCRNFLR